MVEEVMAWSRVWYSLTDEQRAAKRKEYRERYNARHPGAAAKANQKYRQDHKDAYAARSARLEREKKHRNKLRAIAYLGGKCARCGKHWHPCVYHFHHEDPATKDDTINRLLTRSWVHILPELAKCKLLCANCHALEHHEYEWPEAETIKDELDQLLAASSQPT